MTLNVNSASGETSTSFTVTGTGVAEGTSIGAPYNAVTPTRILDTRTSGGAIGPNSVRSVKVTGVGGVPEGAGAVVLNVTATEPTDAGYITVYPTGTVAPTASSLNFTPGQNIANLVTAKVGTGGQVDIYNYSGNTQVLFDVVGWFPNTDAQSADTLAAQAGGGEFVPLVPDRILDTRSGIGAPQAPLGPNSVIDLQITGRGGVPVDGVAAVVMNLTGTNTSAPGYLTAWPTGTTKQTTSNLNFGPGQSVPNLAVVPVGVGGKVSIYNFDGNTDVLGDVVGYYTAPGVTAMGGGLFHAMAPSRFLDTRNTPPALGPGVTGTLTVAGCQGRSGRRRRRGHECDGHQHDGRRVPDGVPDGCGPADHVQLELRGGPDRPQPRDVQARCRWCHLHLQLRRKHRRRCRCRGLVRPELIQP